MWRKLCGRGPTLTGGDEETGLTAMIWQARKGPPACLRALLTVSDVNALCLKEQRNALMWALAVQKTENAFMLIGGTNLAHKARGGVNVLQIALSAGVNDEWASANGRRHAKMLGVLANATEPHEKQWRQIAEVAVASGDFELLRKSAGKCDFKNLTVFEKGMRGRKIKPLMAAARAGNAQMLCFLIAEGHSPSEPDNSDRGCTPLMVAAGRTGQEGALDCVKALLPLVEAEAVNGLGARAIEVAAEAGNAAAFSLLLAKSDPERRDAKGSTLLHELVARVVLKRHPHTEAETLKMIGLLARQADLGSRSAEGKTALEIAAQGASWACMDSLMGSMPAKEAAKAMAEITERMLPQTARLMEARELERAIEEAREAASGERRARIQPDGDQKKRASRI